MKRALVSKLAVLFDTRLTHVYFFELEKCQREMPTCRTSMPTKMMTSVKFGWSCSGTRSSQRKPAQMEAWRRVRAMLQATHHQLPAALAPAGR